MSRHNHTCWFHSPVENIDSMEYMYTVCVCVCVCVCNIYIYYIQPEFRKYWDVLDNINWEMLQFYAQN